MSQTVQKKPETIAPEFNRDVEYAAAALRDFFLLLPGADIPVTKLTITVDGTKHKPAWVPGHATLVLALLYRAVLKQSTSFAIDHDDRQFLWHVFGPELMVNAQQPAAAHAGLERLLTGTTASVQLTLASGWVLPQGPGRGIRKLIEYAWKRHHEHRALRPTDAVPLVREALRQFSRGIKDGSIQIVHTWETAVWPSLYWEDHVWELWRHLKMT